MDIYSIQKRSEVMRCVKARDTAPEVTVRRILHKLGFRYRLHVPSLPGRPDIVLPKHRRIIFVHGCFWHLHRHCKASRLPKSRRAWWRKKLKGNVFRDSIAFEQLKELGWKVDVIWECETQKQHNLVSRLTTLMGVPLT